MRYTLVAALALAGGCNQGPPPPLVDLVVDSNRSGLLEPGDPSEDADETTWDAKHGAVFLANLDDDDNDGKPDAEDAVINGATDIADLSPIALRPWPGASPKASGTLSIDAATAAHVRLFRVTGAADDPKSYVAVTDPTKVALTSADLIAGVNFALEGLELKTSTMPGAWDGLVSVAIAVTDPAITDELQKPLLTDSVKLRVAPVLFQFNTAPTEKIFYTEAGAYTRTLVDGMTPMAAAAGKPIDPLDLDGLGLEVDVWAQDYFDVGYMSKPGPGGKPVGIKLAIRSAQPDRSAGQVTSKYFFGPDWASIEIADKNPQGGHSYSMNSFGNYDVIPPYEKGADKYPLGRNYFGWTTNPRESPDAVFSDFVRAQAVQPAFNVDTSWLGVGHVDEFTSWVKANSPRGWKMLRAAPGSARNMLQGLGDSGHGNDRLFVDKTQYDYNARKEVPAAVAVTAVLANANLMAASQSAQSKIDSETAKLIAEIGLSPDEVIDMPFLYERSFGGAGAYIPGTVNLLHVDGKVLIPDPFGPEIGGVDPFKADLRERLGAIGLDVYFADDWDTFHLGSGEVHCGTNVQRDMTLRWWESGR